MKIDSTPLKARSPVSSVLDFLYGLQSFGIKLGLENIGALLSFLGDPHTRFPSVHIAGTNGKGSTAAMIAAALTAAGYKTGLYTSPHLVRFNERIRIDGVDIPDEELVRYTRIMRRTIIERRATFFEATTAIAFAHFAEQKVDIAVIEVGLGGLHDATNVLDPLASVITTIGLDHQEYLGTTIEEIAEQKGGIIKPGRACVLGTMAPSALAVLRRIARRRKAVCIESSNAAKWEIDSMDACGITVDLATEERRYRGLRLELTGRQQADNAAVAVLVLERLRKYFGYTRMTAASLRAAFRHIRKYSGLRGRIDILRASPLIIGDVAHNPQAIRNLCAQMRMIVPGRVITVFGVMADKEYPAMITPLMDLSRLIVAVQPATERALGVKALCATIHDQKAKCIQGGAVSQGLARAIREVRVGETILVTGSHYVLGEAMAALASCGETKNRPTI